MKAKEAKEAALPRFVDLELTADKAVIDKGQKVTLQWRAHADAQLTLWQSTAAALETESLDWHHIRDMGERVEVAGRRQVTPAETTGYFLVAQTPFGMRGEKVVVEVRTDHGVPAETGVWSPKKEFLDQLKERSYVIRRVTPHQFQPEMLVEPMEALLRWARPWACGGAPPGITLTPANAVIFEDESVTVKWNVTNATCANPGLGVDCYRLVPGSICGTQLDGGSIGTAGYLPCIQTSGSETFPEPPWTGASHIVLGVSALNSSQSASASVWIDVLSLPQFKGNATAVRIADIKAAIKDIDTKLRDGCIYNDLSLDTTVAAFKNGQLKRQAFWWRLLVELQNLKLDSFVCNDVADQDWGGGHWSDYTNDILLDWSPSYTPNLGYVILHELVHKCGFNHALPYSVAEIENQAHTVSGSCYP